MPFLSYSFFPFFSFCRDPFILNSTFSYFLLSHISVSYFPFPSVVFFTSFYFAMYLFYRIVFLFFSFYRYPFSLYSTFSYFFFSFLLACLYFFIISCLIWYVTFFTLLFFLFPFSPLFFEFIFDFFLLVSFFCSSQILSTFALFRSINFALFTLLFFPFLFPFFSYIQLFLTFTPFLFASTELLRVFSFLLILLNVSYYFSLSLPRCLFSLFSTFS